MSATRWFNVTPSGYEKCQCGCFAYDGVIVTRCTMHEVAKAIEDADMAHDGKSSAYENMAIAALDVVKRTLGVQ